MHEHQPLTLRAKYQLGLRPYGWEADTGNNYFSDIDIWITHDYFTNNHYKANRNETIFKGHAYLPLA